jgi:hypothetical protein
MDQQRRGFSIDTQVMLVYALTALHNLLNLFNISMDDEEMLTAASSDEDEMEDISANAVNQRGKEAMDSLRDEVGEELWESYDSYMRVKHSGWRPKSNAV